MAITVLAAAIGVALLGLRPTTLKVVPEPRRMVQAYERAIEQGNPEEVLLATLVPTKAEAFAISKEVDQRKVRCLQLALGLLLLGFVGSAASVAWEGRDSVEVTQRSSATVVTGLGGGWPHG